MDAAGRTTDPRAAVHALPDGALVVAGACCATPTTLLRALGDMATAARGWQLWSGLLLGPLDFVPAVREGRLAYRTWQVARGTRGLVADGYADYLPLRASQVPEVLARCGVDAALVRVSPPDRRGDVSLGTSLTYTRSLVAHARMVIGEVDPAMPHTEGRSRVPVSTFAVLVESEDPTPEYRSLPPSPMSRQIAAHVLPLLPDRPVLQLGLGSVPEALTAQLVDAEIEGPVRCVGMGNDAMVGLFEAGVMALGAVHPDPALAAVELLGTRMLFDLADRNPAIGLYPVEEVGDPRELARLDRFVAVNSAVEVDLSGQCNLEWAAGRHVAGIGGSVDFMEAARGSAGGVRIVALPATVGDHSRIVARLPAEAPVTIPRHDVDYVVTEHGVAALAGRTLRERAEALVAVAAPEHRNRLAADLETSSGAPNQRC